VGIFLHVTIDHGAPTAGFFQPGLLL